jgi:hypothetical protein
MKSFATSLVVLASIIVFGGCATPHKVTSRDAVPECWRFKLDSATWQLGYEGEDGDQALREYVPKRQTVNHWTEMVSSVRFKDPVSPQAMYGIIKFGILLGCSSAHVSVIEETDDSILFEWWQDDCGGNPAQHEIRRICAGARGTYSLSYVQKTHQMSSVERDRWISIIKAARVRPDA